MSLYLDWEQIALRLVLACAAGFVIGFNRDEHGHPAGIRTTMLVCLAATLAMLQVNLLLHTSGKPASSFINIDLMRLPLGILSGIGFIGAGVIVKHGADVSGVTTAATMWLVTVLGLLFGGGNLGLGIVGSLLAVAILWGLKFMERYIRRECRASLHLAFSADSLSEADLRQRLRAANWTVEHWTAVYDPATLLAVVECDLKSTARATHTPDTPPLVEQFRAHPGVRSVTWKE
jgi:putative Mg2+ transporter-C (MgtC) family protein